MKFHTPINLVIDHRWSPEKEFKRKTVHLQIAFGMTRKKREVVKVYGNYYDDVYTFDWHDVGSLGSRDYVLHKWIVRYAALSYIVGCEGILADEPLMRDLWKRYKAMNIPTPAEFMKQFWADPTFMPEVPREKGLPELDKYYEQALLTLLAPLNPTIEFPWDDL